MNDFISRQAVIEAIRKTYVGIHDANIDGDFLADEIESIIKKVPTVQITDDASVVHGKWLYKAWTYKGSDIGVFICSNCGHANWIKEHNYCPTCGAKMGV